MHYSNKGFHQFGTLRTETGLTDWHRGRAGVLAFAFIVCCFVNVYPFKSKNVCISYSYYSLLLLMCILLYVLVLAFVVFIQFVGLLL